MAASRTVVLVHGLWHGGWCWQAVIEQLAALGVRATAPELAMRTLAGDVDTVREVLDAQDGDIVLVGHSYGGAVITGAGDHPRVRELVYLAGFALTEQESISRVAPEAGVEPTQLGSALLMSEDGTEISVDPARVRELMYHRSPPDVADAAIARLRPVARALFSARPAVAAWRERPSTYVVCTDDRTVAPALQRIMASRTTRTLERDSDHSPMALDPAGVAELIVQRRFSS